MERYAMELISEQQLCAELELTGCVRLRSYAPEARGVNTCIGRAKLHMIERIECFRPQLNRHLTIWVELFKQREVRGHQLGREQPRYVSGASSERESCRLREI